jgi:lipoate-protein ligase A
VDTDLTAMDSVLRHAGGPKPSERVTTLAALLGHTPDMDEVKTRVRGAISDAFGVRMDKDVLTGEEEGHVGRLVKERYSRDEWNLRL